MLERAKRRMKFDELFYFELSLALRKESVQVQRKGNVIDKKSERAKQLLELLPFSLTGAQRKVLQEILADMAGESPMNRLLQGDVGSGKTVVAVLAMLVAIDNGYQCVMMA